MAQSTLTQTNWFGGQIAEERHGYASDELYFSSSATIQNLVVRPTGSLTRRPGTKFVARSDHNDILGNESNKVRLIPFVFGHESANNYVLEFGHRNLPVSIDNDSGDLRFQTATNHGLLEGDIIQFSATTTMPGNITAETDYHVKYVDATTFKVSASMGGTDGEVVQGLITYHSVGSGVSLDLGYIKFYKSNAVLAGESISGGDHDHLRLTGSPYNSATKLGNLQFIQSADILFFSNPDVHPYKLSRTIGTTDATWRTGDGFIWTLEILDIQDGPYLDQQEDGNTGSTGTTITVSGGTPITAHSSTNGLAFLNPNFGGATQKKAQNAMYNGATGNLALLSYFQVKNHGLQDGMKITLSGGNSNTSYEPHDGSDWYVRDPTANTFRVSDGSDKGPIIFTADLNGEKDHEIFAQYYASGSELTLTAKDLSGSTVAMFHPNDNGRLFRISLLKQDQVYWVWGTLSVSGSAYTQTATLTLKVDCPVTGDLSDITSWKLGAFYKGNYPHHVTIFQQRMAFGRNDSSPQTIWLSETGDFIGFRPSETLGSATGETSPTGAAIIGDQILATNGMTFTFDSGTIDEIQWFLAQEKLLAGTTGGVYAIYGSEQDLTMSPFNFTIKREGTQPAQTGVNATGYDNNALYIQGTGKKVRLVTFGDVEAQAKSIDLTIRANDILNQKAKQITEGDIPNWVTWFRMGDGSVVGLTYIPQDGTIAWHKHLIGGNYTYSETRGGDPSGHLTDDAEHAVVLDMCVIPTTTHDQIWMLVRRTITVADSAVFTASSSSGLLLTSNSHLLVDGDVVQVSSAGTLPTGLSVDTNYYVRDKITDNFKLATISGGTAIAYTNAGSGVHTWTAGSERIVETVEMMENWISNEAITESKYVDGFAEDTTGSGTFETTGYATDHQVDLSAGHGLEVGDVIRVSSTNTLPSPLTANTDYYVKTVESPDAITIATVSASGTTVDFTDAGSATHTFHKRSINNLDHLQGEEVSILVDGSVVDSQTVTSNKVVPIGSSYSTRAIAGKEYTSKLITLPISMGPDGRVRIGNKKRIHRVWAKTYKTPNFKFAVFTSDFTDDDLTELVTRTVANQYGEAPHLSSESQELVPSSQGFTEGQFLLQQTDPLPMNILALELDYETNDN